MKVMKLKYLSSTFIRITCGVVQTVKKGQDQIAQMNNVKIHFHMKTGSLQNSLK